MRWNNPITNWSLPKIHKTATKISRSLTSPWTQGFWSISVLFVDPFLELFSTWHLPVFHDLGTGHGWMVASAPSAECCFGTSQLCHDRQPSSSASTSPCRRDAGRFHRKCPAGSGSFVSWKWPLEGRGRSGIAANRRSGPIHWAPGDSSNPTGGAVVDLSLQLDRFVNQLVIGDSLVEHQNFLGIFFTLDH